MSESVTARCGQGADLIWKQCNEELFGDGLIKLESAAREGCADAWYFLGQCYARGDGGAGYNERKACDCFRRGIRGGSAAAALGAFAAGLYDEGMRKISPRTLSENYTLLKTAAEDCGVYEAWLLAEMIERGLAEEALADKPEPPAEAAGEEPAAEAEKTVPETEGPAPGDEPAAGTEDEAPEPEDAAEEEPVPAQEDCFSWYLIAAKGGIIRAMEKVGECLKNGTYTEKNPSGFLEYAGKAASLGSAWGLLEMGRLAREEHPEDAFLYFEASARQGSEEAEYLLGTMYLEGEGCERDIREGAACLERAAARGSAKSMLELGELFYRDRLAEREDQRAYYWYSRALDSGEKEALLPLAHLCTGESECRNLSRAETLFREADEFDETGEAALALGNLYRDGLLGSPDPESAAFWYERGASKDNTECMERLGILFYRGEDGVEVDYPRAFSWLSRCYEKGTLQSKSKLGYLYLKGLGCEADEKKAVRLFEEAAEYEYDGFALYELGYIHECRDTRESLEAAADYYQKAAAMGNENAAKRLSHFRRTIFGRWRVIP